MTRAVRFELHAYDPAWHVEFERDAEALASVLRDLAIRIDHIGSTSIPGMAAKDVIDVQVLTAALEPEGSFVDAFAELGFRGRSDPWNRRDHIPEGWEGPASQWDKLVFSGPDGRCHVHVRVQGCANARYALLFRDYLRANPGAARAWSAFKRALAERFPEDLAAYGQIKDPATDVLMSAAERWAEEIDWSP